MVKKGQLWIQSLQMGWKGKKATNTILTAPRNCLFTTLTLLMENCVGKRPMYLGQRLMYLGQRPFGEKIHPK